MKTAAQAASKDERVLIVAPEREALLTYKPLAQAGFYALGCHDASTLHEVLREGAGAVLLAETALNPATLEVLGAALDAQPDGLELPLLYLAGGNTDKTEYVTKTLRKRVFVLESPLPCTTLLSAVRLALGVRRQQNRARDLSAQLKVFSKDRDTRAEKQAAELHYSEVRFSTVFDASPIPVAITTLSEGRYLEVNESALKLLGFRREEVIGRRAAELSRWEQETSKTRDKLLLLRSVKAEGSLRDVPIDFYTKTGALRNGLASFEIIELSGELCLLSMVLDVTERRRDEAELLQAVKEVMSDTDWFSRSFVEKLAQVRTKGANLQELSGHQAEIKDLTPREQQVLERVAQGYNNRQIADELELSTHTVRNYLANVFEKLDLHSRAEAVVWARKRGLGSGV